MILEIIFWSALYAILHTYAIYPLILLVRTAGRQASRTQPFTDEQPMVSVLISVYNEERVLQQKLENLEALDYTQTKVEFIIGSDGSNDSTNEILSKWSHANKRFIAFKERRGKANVLNTLVDHARGDIIVFSDANTFFKKDTIHKLVTCFADPSVGAVCGKLILSKDTLYGDVSGEALYWNYENAIKELESKTCTLLGATGGVYAIRKHLFVPLPLNKAVADDFVTPMHIVKQGHRVVYQSEAIAYEKASTSILTEFRRRMRIGTQNFHAITEFATLLHPRHGFVAFALWSHKILRWLVPFFLILLLLSSAVLSVDSESFRTVLILEVAFIITAFVGFICERINLNIGAFGLPYYFLAVNMALFVGFIKFLFGSQKPTWEVVR